MPRSKYRRSQSVHGLTGVSCSWWLRVPGWGRNGAVRFTGAIAEVKAAMMAGGAGDEGHGTARGPPMSPTGAGPMLGIGPGLDDHISCNDRDVP